MTEPKCKRCGDTGMVTINPSRSNDPQYEIDVRCGCDDHDADDFVEPDDGPIESLVSHPGDYDWADPWDR